MSTIEQQHSPDYWRGNAAAFRAVAGLVSTIPEGIRAWAEAEAKLADRAAERAEAS